MRDMQALETRPMVLMCNCCSTCVPPIPEYCVHHVTQNCGMSERKISTYFTRQLFHEPMNQVAAIQ
ncbi:hypothetical protein BDQ94DRAFT_143518 [Aspergillus welwitschiae]|uniref:Uncharacterized protein n=1 Tax=Aspergillus welwitschiae TaxID=1341132 RepID=A0A3F3Q3G1_9EURO|nr:hypothetical protein BDQ94DRAFT_143518 [Aspergillus welwitschiae]RDH33661.1 hypothetical protein BDQ94DRAFT_143518 [Aspergillus welwitschiae]